MKISLFLIIEFVLLILLISLMLNFVTKSTKASNEDKVYIAIIIDDFGNNAAGTESMLSLPISFTGAVMPKMPKSIEEKDRLISTGNEAILHQPMESHHGQRSWLGTAPILSSMSINEASKVFTSNINELENIKGFNNHMGSVITENTQIMNEIIKIAKENNLYYLDSVTTGKSVGKAVTDKHGVTYLRRDVFLDSTQNVNKIKENLIKTYDIAASKGYAIAIGHVGAEGGKATYTAILDTYKELENKGVEFVTLSQLVEIINSSK